MYILDFMNNKQQLKETMTKTTSNIITTIVTQDNINKGKCKSNDSCPIALSFKNHKTVKHVSIFEDHAWLFMKHKDKNITHVKQYDFCENMKKFVSSFDKGELVTPQVFTFDDYLLTSDKYL
jgi:hypothetical protein|tara:strand:- start:203 stop:568 length:366 start_codon:yes stop_codon:yes gene_type:complete